MTLAIRKATVAAAVLALGLAGCTNGGGVSNQQVGTTAGGALGAIAGGLAGTQVGSGRGRTAAIIAGTILGGALGAGIGNRLTAEDNTYAQQTTQQALASAPPNQPVRWQNPNTGVYGDVVPTTPIYQQPYSTVYGQQQQPVYGTTYSQPQAVDCRDYKQTIFVDNQRYETATGTACRQADGSWKIVS
jgi:surface antigen